MVEPRRLFFEREPAQCPECGGRVLRPVGPEDVDVVPLDPEETPPVFPGVLQCAGCGTVVQWES